VVSLVQSWCLFSKSRLHSNKLLYLVVMIGVQVNAALLPLFPVLRHGFVVPGKYT